MCFVFWGSHVKRLSGYTFLCSHCWLAKQDNNSCSLNLNITHWLNQMWNLQRSGCDSSTYFCTVHTVNGFTVWALTFGYKNLKKADEWTLSHPDIWKWNFWMFQKPLTANQNNIYKTLPYSPSQNDILILPLSSRRCRVAP